MNNSSKSNSTKRPPINRASLPIDCQVWDADDIAAYFGYSLDYTKRHIISNRDFPPTRPLPTSKDGQRTIDFWSATDIIKFALAFDKSSVNYSQSQHQPLNKKSPTT